MKNSKLMSMLVVLGFIFTQIMGGSASVAYGNEPLANGNTPTPETAAANAETDEGESLPNPNSAPSALNTDSSDDDGGNSDQYNVGERIDVDGDGRSDGVITETEDLNDDGVIDVIIYDDTVIFFDELGDDEDLNLSLDDGIPGIYHPDDDGDGATNMEEGNAGTDPDNPFDQPDTDGDGYSDPLEESQLTDPEDPNDIPDFSEDGQLEREIEEQIEDDSGWPSGWPSDVEVERDEDGNIIEVEIEDATGIYTYEDEDLDGDFELTDADVDEEHFESLPDEVFVDGEVVPITAEEYVDDHAQALEDSLEEALSDQYTDDDE